jgi:hypothetical protein
VISIFILIFFQSLLAFAADPIFTKENIKMVQEGNSWVSERVEFEYPANKRKMYVLATGSPESLIQVTDLLDPTGYAYVSSTSNGKKITSYSQPILQNVKSPNRSEAVSPGTATLIVPNSPTVPALRAGVAGKR